MPEDHLSPAVLDVKRHIAAAAILKEAARLAGNNSTSPNSVTPDRIQKAVEAYRAVFDEMKKQGF